MLTRSARRRRFRCNSRNHPPGCTCGFGGYGHLGRRGPSYVSTNAGYFNSRLQPSRSWRLESLRRPLTYPTSCWWCSEPIFYHTNGNGDCVLLDPPLGSPWHVHGCWEQHRDQQHRQVSHTECALLVSGFDGHAYTTSREYVSAPKTGTRKVSVCGYISLNDAHESDREEIDLSHFQNCPSFPWVRIVVRDAGGNLFPFIIPIATARELSLYAMVRVTGRWARVHASDHLIAERVTIMNYPGDQRTVRRVVTLGKRVTCAYCGKSVRRGKWGIDSARRVECAACALLRGTVNKSKRFFAAN